MGRCELEIGITGLIDNLTHDYLTGVSQHALTLSIGYVANQPTNGVDRYSEVQVK